ncbi:gamma-glutamyl-gamma-aminobutyrate hydrolase family protein [Aliiglaciecola sp. CAU 1673]|uniref:gamma-glutamyl-gamma-aminobutyrate hydrolase family protein n=1 Tax=Aliiglaciecola sp. CAU 1673 TaxID=3032595 RepID=UPI0023DC029B|nr:gamma-glutamyl-gamma-aminobutyrate hydrolase family protein [Aliiglaciecola sp. CAU 1673]MDF2177059.1 gamma-glutamyl-gamma-aminobutyrate hydrolase family protein [Aliiglaciecola sp. CAU 1673]
MSAPLLIGVCADVTQQGAHAFHQAGDKYLRALSVTSPNVAPIIIPAFFHELSAAAQEALLGTLDGLMLTGSYSNLHPSYYQQSLKEGDDASRDPHRDASNWALLELAMAKKLPILAICRGFQELNVYFGGSLHHRIHEVEGLMDHREDKSRPIEEQYAPAHPVKLLTGGYLAKWFSPNTSIEVNSIHMQGVDRLGKGLHIEAQSEDGLVEAFSLDDYPFLLAVQWHPEWKPQQYPQNAQIIQGFINTCSAVKAQGKIG